MQLFNEKGAPREEEIACALAQREDDLLAPGAELASCPTRFEYLNASIELMGCSEESGGGFSGLRLYLNHRGKQIAEVAFLGIESRSAIPEVLDFLSSNPDGLNAEKGMTPETLKKLATVLSKGGALIKSEMGVDPEGLADEYRNRMGDGNGLEPKVLTIFQPTPESPNLRWVDIELELPDVAPTRKSVLEFVSEMCAGRIPPELNFDKLEEGQSSFLDIRLFGDDPKGKKVVIGDKLAFFVSNEFVVTIHSGATSEWAKITNTLSEQLRNDPNLRVPRTLSREILAKAARANEQQINMLADSADRLDHLMQTTRNLDLDTVSKQIAGLSGPALYCASKMVGFREGYSRFIAESPEDARQLPKKEQVREVEIRQLLGTIEAKAHRTVKTLNQLREQEENLVSLRSAIVQKSTNVLAALLGPGLVVIGLLDAYGATWGVTAHALAWGCAALSTLAVLAHGKSKGWL